MKPISQSLSLSAAPLAPIRQSAVVPAPAQSSMPGDRYVTRSVPQPSVGGEKHTAYFVGAGCAMVMIGGLVIGGAAGAGLALVAGALGLCGVFGGRLFHSFIKKPS